VYTLLQIIIYLNFLQDPDVNIITHTSSLESCEKKLYATYNRFIKGGMFILKKYDDNNNLYLKIEMKKENSESLWFCKKTIFYKP
tara:strand:+ start:163 stop:417 length:255 start_codon:yes stop_codon:yes gene_type:complete